MGENQRVFRHAEGLKMGFLSLIPARVWEYIAILIALAAFGGYMFWRGGEGPRAELATVKAQYAAFQSQVKVLGDNAQKAADAEKAKDLANKENADHENAVTAAANASVIAKLRHDLATRSGGNYLPPAPSGSNRPDLACYDRTALELAVRDFVTDIRGQVDQGTAATIDLNTARMWAASP